MLKLAQPSDLQQQFGKVGRSNFHIFEGFEAECESASDGVLAKQKLFLSKDGKLVERAGAKVGFRKTGVSGARRTSH